MVKLNHETAHDIVVGLAMTASVMACRTHVPVSPRPARRDTVLHSRIGPRTRWSQWSLLRRATDCLS